MSSSAPLPSRNLQKRFYTRAEGVTIPGATAIHLDGRPVRTPGRRPLAVPPGRFAAAVVGEWAGQKDVIEPASMVFTRLANTAIDGVADRLAEVQDAVIAYVASDLLYYRAAEPGGLVERQNAAWDPILAWASERFGAGFVLTQSVLHVEQPSGTLERLAAAVRSFDEPFRLTGLHMATTLTGSVLIALALAEGRLDVEGAWSAGHVDEDWNISRWGADAEAMARREARLRDFRAASAAMERDGGREDG